MHFPMMHPHTMLLQDKDPKHKYYLEAYPDRCELLGRDESKNIGICSSSQAWHICGRWQGGLWATRCSGSDNERLLLS